MSIPNQPPLDDRGLPTGYKLDPARETMPREVKARLDRGEQPGREFELIDCRLPHEWEITRIEGARLVPLQQLAERFGTELAGKEEREVIVYCRSGMRSLQFVDALRSAGFKNARSMAGGVLLWNRDINPGGPQY